MIDVLKVERDWRPPSFLNQPLYVFQRAMDEHKTRVQTIATQVKAFHDRGERYRIYHGTTSTTRKTKLDRNAVVDTSRMDHVLHIDEEKLTALVEPNVSMDKLVDSCLEHGLIPQVVMEFPAITVGGGFAGTAGESSSFRHGLFDQTINRIEIVLATGEIRQASRTEQRDLYDAAAGSFGTFGVITSLEVQLVRSKPFVELTYAHVGDMEAAVRKIEACTADPDVEYLEGIMFGLEKGLIIYGSLMDKPNPALRQTRYLRAKDPWFYLRAKEILDSELDDFYEIVPIKDYFFRYDRGTFWAGYYAFKYFITPFNYITRWALDSLLRTKVAYHALHKSHMADQYIVQDIGFPYATVGKFVEYVHNKFGFYPLWLCPLKMDKNMSLRPKNMAAFAPDARSPGMMLNIGLWGPGAKQYDRFIAENRDIERKTAELGGLKCFYAQAFYTPDEFWVLYDKQWYDDLRERFHATKLPSVYDKVNVDLTTRTHTSEQGWSEWMYEKFKEQWPVRGVYGVLQVFISPEYLLAK